MGKGSDSGAQKRRERALKLAIWGGGNGRAKLAAKRELGSKCKILKKRRAPLSCGPAIEYVSVAQHGSWQAAEAFADKRLKEMRREAVISGEAVEL